MGSIDNYTGTKRQCARLVDSLRRVESKIQPSLKRHINVLGGEDTSQNKFTCRWDTTHTLFMGELIGVGGKHIMEGGGVGLGGGGTKLTLLIWELLARGLGEGRDRTVQFWTSGQMIKLEWGHCTKL